MSATDSGCFVVERSDNGIAAVYRCSGELDLATSPILRQALSDAGDRDVVLDFADVSFCDSSGLAVLLRLARSLAPNGHTVTLLDPTPVVRRVLEVMGCE